MLTDLLSTTDHQIALGAFDRMSLRKGQELYREGQRAYGVYYVLTGLVKVHKLGSDGKEQIIKVARTASFLGYAELLANAQHQSTATALTESQVVFIPKEDFQGLLLQDGGMLDQFIQLMFQDIAFAEEKMTSMAYTPVRGRLAEALVGLSESGRSKTILLSRNDLAHMIGTASETVIRLLAEFKNEHLVKLNGRSIEVLDTAGLQRINRMYT